MMTMTKEISFTQLSCNCFSLTTLVFGILVTELIYFPPLQVTDTNCRLSADPNDRLSFF